MNDQRPYNPFVTETHTTQSNSTNQPSSRLILVGGKLVPPLITPARTLKEIYVTGWGNMFLCENCREAFPKRIDHCCDEILAKRKKEEK